MTKMSLIYSLTKEIKKINNVIDQKIVKGSSYDREARRHKDLVKQIKRLESEAAFARTLAFLF